MANARLCAWLRECRCSALRRRSLLVAGISWLALFALACHGRAARWLLASAVSGFRCICVRAVGFYVRCVHASVSVRRQRDAASEHLRRALGWPSRMADGIGAKSRKQKKIGASYRYG